MARVYSAALLLISLSLFPKWVRAETLKIGLRDSEERALAYSPRLKAVSAELEAAKNGADSRRALLYPRIALDASYHYVTEVPSLQIGAVKQSFGDHRATSVGPTLSWTLW